MLIKRFALIATVLFGAFSISPAIAQDDTSGYLMTETERQAIEEIVRNYIQNNPDVILEAVETNVREKAAKQREDQAKVTDVPAGLYENAPFAGDENAEITIVEFFDYNCGYCKRVINDVNRLAEDEDSIKVVFRELPILSESSEEASRFALAAAKQGQYLEYHNKLMRHRGRLKTADLENYGTELGLDLDQLREDAQSQDVIDEISANMAFARELSVRGTPFFLVGKRKVPGAVGYTRLKSIIAEELGKTTGGGA